MLLRRILRPLLAAPFFYDGIRTAIWPSHKVPKWHRQLARLEQLSPEVNLTETQVTGLVRAYGAANALLALTLSLGVFPRASALGLAALAIDETIVDNPFEHSDDEDRGDRVERFVGRLGRVGAALLAGIDFEGKPGAKWRIEHARRTREKEKHEAS
jgi:hypothetical protein